MSAGMNGRTMPVGTCCWRWRDRVGPVGNLIGKNGRPNDRRERKDGSNERREEDGKMNERGVISRRECVARCHSLCSAHRCTLREGNAISCDLSTSSRDPLLRPWRALPTCPMNHSEEMICKYLRTDDPRPTSVSQRPLEPRVIVRAFESYAARDLRLPVIFATDKHFYAPPCERLTRVHLAWNFDYRISFE